MLADGSETATGNVFKTFVNFIGKHLCRSLFFIKVAGLELYYKRDSDADVFCGFCEIFKNILFI